MRMVSFHHWPISFSGDRLVARNVVWGFEFRTWMEALTEWRLRRGYPLPSGMGSGRGLWCSPENFCIFSFKMVHFDAFWAHFTPTVIVTMMFLTSAVTFLSCTCSTVQQKGRPRKFCADFSGGFQLTTVTIRYGIEMLFVTIYNINIDTNRHTGSSRWRIS